jgi:PAS domain S-box-containing protein
MSRRSFLVPIVAGFSITLLILLAIIAASISHIDRIGSETTAMVVDRGHKAGLASRMQALHKLRFQALLLASHLEDPFARDEQMQAFARLADEFVGLREQFLGLNLDPDEQVLWQAIRTRIQEAGAEIPTIVALLEAGELGAARQRLRERLDPVQDRLMQEWGRLAAQQADKNTAAIANARKAESRIRRLAIGLGGIALLIGGVIATFAVRSSRRMERDHCENADQARLILDTLPEAVLRFGEQGDLLYLNPAAERLLGRRGRQPGPMEATLNLVERNQRLPLTPDLAQELQRGLAVSLPAETCLIASSGMEYEVEGQAISINDGSGVYSGAIVCLRDVTERREQQRRQALAGEVDSVCGLPLAAMLVERLERKLLSKRAQDRELAYLHIELADLAELANKGGPALANPLLRQAGQLMFSRIRDTDTLACLDSQSFGLLLPACPAEVAERIRQTLIDSVGALSFDGDGGRRGLKARIGVVHAPPFAGAYDECQAQARAAARSQA